jgi:hypothetical protein
MYSRRLLLVAIASVTTLALVPGVALARRHHRHHHHSLIRHERFGADPSSPTTTPTTAGTVVSFTATPTGGVLTIKLNDGTMVTGKVTPDTEIECQSSQTMSDDIEGPSSGTEDQGDNNQTGDNDQGEDQDQNENEGQACTTALTMNAVVQEAELTISGAGKVWTEIELA